MSATVFSGHSPEAHYVHVRIYYFFREYHQRLRTIRQAAQTKKSWPV
jgi:hypothetical protein